MYRIMIVDDEENVLKALQRSLRSETCEIETYTDGASALKRAMVANCEMIISDYRMPGMNGVELLKEIKELQPDAVRIILSGYADIDVILAAINDAEIYRFILKPWHTEELKVTVERALAHRAVIVENRHLAERVRSQTALLNRQQEELARLEAQNPGITQVKWGADGSIVLDD